MYNNIVEASQNMRLPKQHNWTVEPEDRQIVKQIRNEYARKTFGFDFDDLEQELWLKVYEVRSCYDNPNPAFMAKCLRNHIASWFKKEIYYRKSTKSRATFEGTSEEKMSTTDAHTMVNPAGRILKAYIIAFYLHPSGLSIEMRDYMERFFKTLTPSQIETIHKYSYNEPLLSKDKVSMYRMIGVE